MSHTLNADTLDETLLEPVSGLRYRMRAARGGLGKAPCLIFLHGVGANETGFIELARQTDPRLTVILARAPLEFGPMQFGWFQVAFTATGPVINAAHAEQARHKLLAFIDQLPQIHEIDPGRVWIAGFSQGGIMSASVGLTAPDKVAGFAILSGRVLPEVLPAVRPEMVKTEAFISHGTQDQKLGIHFAHHAKQVSTDFGVSLTYREYAAGHVLQPAMVRDFQQWLATQMDAPGNTHV
ncbi:MAG TPA: phospholipase [Janthinobacterium sp.]|nr:phospholipase [Janthinobacterium sp.]